MGTKSCICLDDSQQNQENELSTSKHKYNESGHHFYSKSQTSEVSNSPLNNHQFQQSPKNTALKKNQSRFNLQKALSNVGNEVSEKAQNKVQFGEDKVYNIESFKSERKLMEEQKQEEERKDWEQSDPVDYPDLRDLSSL